MIYINILCEGQTEEAFINNFLSKYFQTFNIYVTPIIVTTKRMAEKTYKGGKITYIQLVKQIQNLCKDRTKYTTIMIDYYGLPSDFPGNDNQVNDTYEQIKKLEDNLKNDVNRGNFIPYLSLHEFESMLFSNPNAFLNYGDKVVKQVKKILDDFNGNPELINNSTETAPSKRLNQILNGYEKIFDSDKILKQTSISKIMEECNHFSKWITNLKQLKQPR